MNSVTLHSVYLMCSTNTSVRIFTFPFSVLLDPVHFSKLEDRQACGKLRALQRDSECEDKG